MPFDSVRPDLPPTAHYILYVCFMPASFHNSDTANVGRVNLDEVENYTFHVCSHIHSVPGRIRSPPRIERKRQKRD